MNSALLERARKHLALTLPPQSKGRLRLLADRDWRDTTIAMPTAIAAMAAFVEEERARGDRGYRVTYQPGVTCPGCGGTNFHVGRVSAECAGCGVALPFASDPKANPMELAHG